jgi:hypothetical protein
MDHLEITTLKAVIRSFGVHVIYLELRERAAWEANVERCTSVHMVKSVGIDLAMLHRSEEANAGTQLRHNESSQASRGL